MDPYELLGVTRGCAPDELKEAFRMKALLAHPDRGGDAAAFIELRQAYDQIVAEHARRAHAAKAAPAGRSGRTERNRWEDEHAHKRDPDWQPDLIVADEPLPRVRPVRPPEPNWEPELVVKDEPLPRIRPVRPPDSNWEPDLMLDDKAIGHGPSPSRLRTPGVSRQDEMGWLPGMVKTSRAEASSAREGWYGIVGVTAVVSLVILAVWMAWPSTTDVPPTKPSDLTAPSHLPEMLPGAGQLPLPELSHSSSSGTRQVPRLEWPDLSSKTGQALPPR